jgi:hypothetical protein
VMIGMMMMTFLLFFTFVVNTGMLVHAKINLQNAADLAAYAGAATQARQLNTISYLNYEMRRQYKKFLFRYYVMGNVAQKGFPTAPGGKSAHTWSPDGSTNYDTPAVCLIFNSGDNFCQLAKLPKIEGTPTSPTDLINQTLNEQLSALEAIRESNCGKIAQANADVLLLWLYNTDPTLQKLPATLSDPNAQGIITVTQAISQGLGLVPREIILRERIKTMQGYVNQKAMAGVSKSVADGLKTSSDPVGSERTIQAFYSAYDTLGPNIFDDQYVQMDELIPNGGDGANLLGLNDIQASFDTYAIGYNSINGGTCQAILMPVPVRQVPVGVEKDPTTLTYYAVRLKARAKVMFSPFGDMDIKAYAAARPFGSRVGPPYVGLDNQFTFSHTPAYLSQSGIPFAASSLTNNIPNLPVSTGDTASEGQGWDTDFILGTMYQAMGAAPNQAINSSNADSGYSAAMVPNPIEGNLYNIMNDTGNDPFVRNFDINHQSLLWAPVFPPGAQASLQDELKDALSQIFSTPGTLSGPGSFGGPAQAASDAQLQQTLLADMLTYINLLPQRQGENGEGMNVAVITDPFLGPGGRPQTLSGDIMMNSPAQYKTSYVTTNDSAYTAQGRVGYSVKFVSFDSLTAHRSSSNGATLWSNSLNIDEEAKADGLEQIQH